MTESKSSGGTGHCLCGAVQYRYEGEPLTIGVCQCDRCQRQSGSAFLIGVIFPRDAVTIVGKLTTYESRLDGKIGCGATFVQSADRQFQLPWTDIPEFAR